MTEIVPFWDRGHSCQNCMGGNAKLYFTCFRIRSNRKVFINGEIKYLSQHNVGLCAIAGTQFDFDGHCIVCGRSSCFDRYRPLGGQYTANDPGDFGDNSFNGGGCSGIILQCVGCRAFGVFGILCFLRSFGYLVKNRSQLVDVAFFEDKDAVFLSQLDHMVPGTIFGEGFQQIQVVL